MMIPNIRFPVGRLIGTLIFKGKCTTVVVSGKLLSIVVHSSCKLPILGDIYIIFPPLLVLSRFKLFSLVTFI